VDRYVLARNIMLLWLAHHAPAADLFAIWFSLGLSASAHASLHRALDALTGPSVTDHLAKIGIAFWRPEDRRLIGDVLCEWKEMRLEWEQIQAQRGDVLRRFIKMDAGRIAPALTERLLFLHGLSEPRSSQLSDQLQEEIVAYFAGR
jgi:uncharacterized protein YaaW (UPF0174 family)